MRPFLPYRIRWVPLALCAALLAACADQPSSPVPAAPQPGPGGGSQTVLMQCSGRVASREVSCQPAQPGDGPARGDVLVGGQYTNLLLQSSNVAVAADTFAFDMTVQNRLAQPMGTSDGTTADSSGVKVFFMQAIATTGGTGAVTVANADGTATFTAPGQPYFAYRQIIKPDSVSAPRRWKLKLDPGVSTFTFLLYVSTPLQSNILVRVLPPFTTAEADTGLIRVIAKTPSSTITRVTARIADRVAELQQNGEMQYVYFPLVGLPDGLLDVVLTAFNAGGDSAVAVTRIRHAHRPRLDWARPLRGEVATDGTLRLQVGCTAEAPCDSVSVQFSPINYGASLYFKRAAPLDTVIMAPTHDQANGFTVSIIGSTVAGQTDQALRKVYAVTTDKWSLLASGGERMQDYDGTRALYIDESGPNFGPAIGLRVRQSGVESVITTDTIHFGKLSTQGVVYAVDEAGQPSNDRFFEWRPGGTLRDLGLGSDVSAEGDWVALSRWNTATWVHNLATGTSTQVIARYGSPRMAANGKLLLADHDGVHFWLWAEGGEPVAYPPNPGQYNREPAWDGTTLLYQRCVTYNSCSLAAYGPAVNDTLIGLPSSNRWFSNGGYLAYHKGSERMYVRTPAGVELSVAPAAPGFIEALGPNGELAFTVFGNRYVTVPPYNTHVPVGVYAGQVAWRDNGFVVFLGRSVFRLIY